MEYRIRLATEIDVKAVSEISEHFSSDHVTFTVEA